MYSDESSTSNATSTSNLTSNSNVSSNNDNNNIPPPNYSAVIAPTDDNLIGFNLTYDFSAEGFIYLDKIHVRKIFISCAISLILSFFFL